MDLMNNRQITSLTNETLSRKANSYEQNKVESFCKGSLYLSELQPIHRQCSLYITRSFILTFPRKHHVRRSAQDVITILFLVELTAQP